MQALKDLVHLPFTPELTEGGVAFAVRSLSHSFDRIGEISSKRLQRITAGAAVELAFRRFLSSQNILYETKPVLSFTEPDRHDVYLGGRRCDLKSYLISNMVQTNQIRLNPEILLDAPALVPSDQHAADGHAHNDLYLFAFATGRTATTYADIDKAITSGAGHYLLHVFPGSWRNPPTWNPLAPLTLKTELDDAILVELCGRDEKGGFKSHTIHLPPKKKIVVEENFYALSSIHVNRIPLGRLGIHNPSQKNAYILQPEDWGNIWIYGMDIFFAGWLSREDFSRNAKTIYENTKVFQYSRTKTRNLAVAVSALKSFSALVEKYK